MSDTIKPATDADVAAWKQHGVGSEYDLRDWEFEERLIARIDADAVEIKRLRDALDFYACVDHYQIHNAVAPNEVQADCGKRARAAIGGRDE
jgi:hypothetical protein